MVSVSLTLFVAAKLLSWGLIVAFGVWTYRRIDLRSLPWVGAYLAYLGLVGAVLRPIMSPIMEQVVEGMDLGHVPFGWSLGEFMQIWNHGGMFMGALARLALVLLVMSDVAFLLSKAGVKVEGRFLSRLLRLRERSTAWGIVMVALMFLGSAIFLLLYLYYA